MPVYEFINFGYRIKFALFDSRISINISVYKCMNVSIYVCANLMSEIIPCTDEHKRQYSSACKHIYT